MRLDNRRAMTRGTIAKFAQFGCEVLEEGAPNRVGVGLLLAGWRGWFIVNDRQGWSEDDYFQLAERIFRTKGIDPCRKT